MTVIVVDVVGVSVMARCGGDGTSGDGWWRVADVGGMFEGKEWRGKVGVRGTYMWLWGTAG